MSEDAVLTELRDLLLDQQWQRECEVIRDYMPPFPRPETRPTLQIRYNDGSAYPAFLRYSHGPKQGFFWDMYGDDFQTEALAILAISKAPVPRSVAPLTLRIPFEKDGEKK